MRKRNVGRSRYEEEICSKEYIGTRKRHAVRSRYAEEKCREE